MGIFSSLYNFVNDKLIGKVSDYGFEKHHLALFYFLSLVIPFVVLNPWVLWYFAWLILLFTPLFAPFALPFVLANKAWQTWMAYIRSKFLHKQKKVLLEILMPPDTRITPEAMELFLSAIHINPGESTFIAKYIDGSTRPYWSLELVSLEGELHMYIWTWDKFKDFVKSQFYAQFPGFELRETQDYLDAFEVDLDKVGIWGTDYKFTKADAYPIKSYKDFGLVAGKISDDERGFLDPLNTVFEKFASLGEGEVAFLHVMFQYTRNSNWKKEVEDEIDKIYKRNSKSSASSDAEKIATMLGRLKAQDAELVRVLKSSLEKDAFDVGVRSVYIARKEAFKPGTRVGANHVNLFRAFEVPHLNELKGIAHWLAGYDYPWHDPRQKKQNKLRKSIIDASKRRSYFHTPYSFKSFVLTTEELATIFHPPISKKAIGFFAERKAHTKAGPPSNLPV